MFNDNPAQIISIYIDTMRTSLFWTALGLATSVLAQFDADTKAPLLKIKLSDM